VNVFSFQANGNMAFMQTDRAPFPQTGAQFGFASKINAAPLYAAGEPTRDGIDITDAGNVYVLPVPA